MIVRTSTARVIPGRESAFQKAIVDLVADFPSRYAGLLSQEVLVGLGDPGVLVYVSRWRDEQSLEAYAGPGWRDTPVTFPDEDDYLVSPLELAHYVAVA